MDKWRVISVLALAAAQTVFFVVIMFSLYCWNECWIHDAHAKKNAASAELHKAGMNAEYSDPINILEKE